MDADLSRLQQIVSNFGRPPTLLRLATTAAWQAGNRSAERSHRSCWTAEDWAAAIDAASSFLELNQSATDPEFSSLHQVGA